MQDPVVGWLVITAGPGQGRALALGYGRNSIARGPKARISLDFGDLEISRDEHAVITYDPKGRRFYLQHGGGTNLTYLNEQPVLVPTELQGREIIWLGQTQLRFVPFCGEDFDWQSIDSG
jgi:pSer/pThr/pTyr-binding forkhead associated (FHA) protein